MQSEIIATAPAVEVAPSEQVNEPKAQVATPKTTSRKANPKAGYIYQYLNAALSPKSRQSVMVLNDEELAIVRKALNELNNLLNGILTSKKDAIDAAEAKMSARLANEKELKSQIAELRKKMKALKAA